MDEPTSRAEARAASHSRNRFLLIGGGIVAVVILVAIVIAVAGGGGDDSSSTRQTTTLPAKTSVSIPLGNVSAESSGAPAQVSAEQSQAIMKVVGDYLNVATVNPLRSARKAGDLSTLFDAGALARANGVDRAVLLDEGLPKVTGNLNVVGQPVEIVALADRDGTIVLASAKLDVDTTGVTKSAGSLHIIRRGDLVLAPDGSGGWKITSYNIAVARSGGGLDPTTTTVAAPTTSTGPK